jgi:hypothetical protein
MNNSILNLKPGTFSNLKPGALSLIFQRYVIRKKSDNTCVNPKIKHRIHEGMCQVFNSQLGGF